MDEPMQTERPASVNRGERQHNEVHHQKNCDAVVDTADVWMFPEEFQLATHRVINGRSRNRNEVVKEKPENIGRNAALKSVSWADQSSGNAVRHACAIGNKGQDEIEGAGNQTTNKDSRKSS